MTISYLSLNPTNHLPLTLEHGLYLAMQAHAKAVELQLKVTSVI